MAKRGYYPAPVYVATFEDGSIGRISFWSQVGRPVDIARGRRVAAIAYARPNVDGENLKSQSTQANVASFWRTYEPRKIIAGYVEFQGKRLVENQVIELRHKPNAAAILTQARKLLELGQSDAAIALIRAA